jgi:hypothetical protein
MIFTDEEIIAYNDGKGVYDSYYVTVFFNRESITLDQTQQNRWNLLDLCCGGEFQPEIASVYNGLILGNLPSSDRLQLTAMWILFGLPDPDPNQAWANQTIVTQFSTDLASQYFTLFDCRTQMLQYV